MTPTAPRTLAARGARATGVAAGFVLTALVGAGFTALSSYRVAALAPVALAAAVGFGVLALLRPAWALCIAVLLVPLEAYQLPLGGALGALSPGRGALLAIGAAHVARMVLWPERTVHPSLRDAPALALILALLPSFPLGAGVTVVAKIAVNWVGFYLASLAVRGLSRRELLRVLLAMGVGVGVLGLMGVQGYVAGGGAHLSQGGAAVYGRAAAGLSDANYYAGLLVLASVPLLAVVVGVRTPWRWLGAVAVTGATAGVFLSLSRGGILGLALGAGIVIAAFSRSRRAAALVAVALVALVTLNLGPLLRSPPVEAVGERLSSITDSAPTNSRPALWRASLASIAAHPEGLGALQFAVLANERGLTEQGSPLEHAHNVYLNLGVELGAAGLAAFLVWVGQLLHALVVETRRRRAVTYAVAVGLLGALAGYLLQGLTVTLYAVQVIHATFFLLAGAALALRDLDDDGRNLAVEAPSR